MDKNKLKIEATKKLQEIGCILTGSEKDYPSTNDANLLVILFNYPRKKKLEDVKKEIYDKLREIFPSDQTGWSPAVTTNSIATTPEEANEHPFKIVFVKAS
jgi:hypothetical protein